MKTIKEDIKNKEFKRAYLLYGTEEYLKRLYKNKLKEAVLQDSDAMNMAEYAGKGIDEKEVREFADIIGYTYLYCRNSECPSSFDVPVRLDFPDSVRLLLNSC